MSIRKRQYSSGVRYQVQYRDPMGRQRSKQFTTKREATAFEADLVTAIRRGEWADPQLKDIRFADWATDWLASDPGKRETSLARDEIIVRLHLMPTFKNRLLSQITPMDVQKLVNLWTTTNAPQTVNRQYRTLAAIMRSAVNCDVIIKSPCRAIKLPNLERKQVRVVDADELRRLADNMGALGPMAYIGGVLGLRWGEVAGLRVEDLDLLQLRLRVCQQVSKDKSGRPIITAPKTKTAIRTVSMPAELADVLGHHLRQDTLATANADTLIFHTETGGPLHYSNWRRRIWVPACEAAGLDGLGFHDLRRANATAMIAAGVDIKTAQHRLGHADPRMTLAIYAQATTEGDEHAADKLGAALLPKHVDQLLTGFSDHLDEAISKLPLTREQKRGPDLTEYEPLSGFG